MIDFVKILVRHANTVGLLNNVLLEFIGSHSKKTGEILDMSIAKYRGLKIIIYNSGVTLIQGSLHKYMNEGKHNYNDFTLSDLHSVLKDISKKFEIELADCVLQNIEIGVNISLKYSPDEILNNLLFHKCQKFKDVSLKSGNYKQAIHKQYYLKVYDKGTHYSLEDYLMRVEVKFIKMQKINKLGSFTLQDLLSIGSFKPLESLLISEWDNVLLFDTTLKIGALNGYKSNLKVEQWRNANFWSSLTKEEKCRQRAKYRKNVQEHSENRHKVVSSLIVEKWKYLISN